MASNKLGEWFGAALDAYEKPILNRQRFRFEAWIDFQTGNLMLQRDNLTVRTSIRGEIARSAVEDGRPMGQLEMMALGAGHLIEEAGRRTAAERDRADAIGRRLAVAEATIKRLARLKSRRRR